MWPRVNGLRAFTLGRPGEMRDRLNALVISGEKAATAGLWKYDYERHGEAAEDAGERQILLGNHNEVVAVVEITRVAKYRFVDVPWDFAVAEGEGFRDIEHWRDGHRRYYEREGVDVDDDDLVICVWMRVIQRP